MSRESKIIECIERYTKHNGIPPTAEDIAKDVWLSLAAVWQNLWELRSRGRVSFDVGRRPRVKLLPVRPVLEYRGTVR